MRYIIKEETLTDLADVIRYKAGIEEMLSPNEMVDVIDGLTTTTERPFNFEIVGGTTEPVNPIENTIWVNTDVAIGEWQMAYSDPTTRIDGSKLVVGDVWLKVDMSNANYINVFRQNGLFIYLSFCYQWNGNSWEFTNFSIYSNGGWHSATVLFDYAQGTNLLGNPVWDTYKYANDTNTFTPNADGSYCLYFAREGDGDHGYDTVGATFENLIETNGASRVNVTYMLGGETGNGVDIQHWIRAVDSTAVNAGTADLTYYDSVEVVAYSYEPIVEVGTLHTVTLDISNCSSFYLQFLFGTYISHKTKTHIYNVTMSYS